MDERQMDDTFIDSMSFLEDEFDWTSQYNEPIQQLEKQGYVCVPDWMPVPLPGYELSCVCGVTMMMRPKPSWHHWLRYCVLGGLRRRLGV